MNMRRIRKIAITLLSLVVLLSALFAASASPAELERVRIAAGGTHSMAVSSDGVLWVWGENTFGQLGDGVATVYDDQNQITRNNDMYEPMRLLDNIVEIAAGDGFSLAVNADGELFSWGINTIGQLGDGTTIQRATPQKIMDGVSQVAASPNTAVAIKADNSLWMWGSDVTNLEWNESLGGYNYFTTPVHVMDNVKKAAVGSGHVIILDKNGDVYGIGNTSNLGINDREPNNYAASPVLILSGVMDIAASSQQGYALLEDGTLYGWGANGSDGSVGTGSDEWWVYAPEIVSTDVKQVFPGNLFIKADGTLWTWGAIDSAFDFRATVDGEGVNTGGMLLDGYVANYGKYPVIILNDIVMASGSGWHMMAVGANGDLYTWGTNQFGQLGTGKANVYDVQRVSDGEYEDIICDLIEDNNLPAPAVIKNLIAAPVIQA